MMKITIKTIINNITPIILKIILIPILKSYLFYSAFSVYSSGKAIYNLVLAYVLCIYEF